MGWGEPQQPRRTTVDRHRDEVIERARAWQVHRTLLCEELLCKALDGLAEAETKRADA